MHHFLYSSDKVNNSTTNKHLNRTLIIYIKILIKTAKDHSLATTSAGTLETSSGAMALTPNTITMNASAIMIPPLVDDYDASVDGGSRSYGRHAVQSPNPSDAWPRNSAASRPFVSCSFDESSWLVSAQSASDFTA